MICLVRCVGQRGACRLFRARKIVAPEHDLGLLEVRCSAQDPLDLLLLLGITVAGLHELVVLTALLGVREHLMRFTDARKNAHRRVPQIRVLVAALGSASGGTPRTS